ncbi:MAG: hypothetical protein M1835_002093 [Candelina submexicana]|nr:MAG: hypothetical protein M1835_002093 [Candelina submexicana]
MTFTKEFGHTTAGIAVRVEFTATITTITPPPHYEFSITTTNASELINPSYTNVTVPYLVKPAKSRQPLKKRIARIFNRKETRSPTYVDVFSSRHAYMKGFEELEKMPHYAARKERLVAYEARCEEKVAEVILSRL